MATIFTGMKYIKLMKRGLAALMLMGVVTACQTKTTDEAEAPMLDSASLRVPAKGELDSDQSALLQVILGSNNDNPQSILRGVAFGDPISKVKAVETFEMFEETSDHLGYTSETPQLESIDVQYFFGADKKVSKITVDVYLNSDESTQQLWNAGKNHFTEIYANPKDEKGVLIWNKKSVRINMENVSKGKDFGLKFEFFPSGKTILAAK